MLRLVLVGIGPGDVKGLSLRAVEALEGADLILIPRKGAEKAELAALRRAIRDGLSAQPPIAEFDLPTRDAAHPDYLQGVRDWHDAVAGSWRAALAAHLPQGGRAALMIWGDPSLYDSSLRIAARLREARIEVIPGATSLQALTAAHRIPLNPLGGSVLITTGRRLRADGWPDCADAVAVMLDGECAFQSLNPAGVEIFWGAYLGMEGALLDSGPLAETGPRIAAARAAARAQRGWIMDCYLLRRRRGEATQGG